MLNLVGADTQDVEDAEGVRGVSLPYCQLKFLEEFTEAGLITLAALITEMAEFGEELL
jgi:hypothetical protein